MKTLRISLVVLALALGLSPVLWALLPSPPADLVRSYIGAEMSAPESSRPAARRPSASRTSCDVALLVAQLLDHPSSDLREEAVSKLGRCGPGLPVLALVQALEDQDVNVRWAVDRTLADMGPDAAEAVPALIRLLDDRDRKEWASWVLYRIGAPAVPPLVEQLDSHRPDVKRSAAFVLRSMGLRPAAVRQRCRRGCQLTLRSTEGIPVQVTIVRSR